MALVQVIQTLGAGLTPSAAWAVPFGLAVCLVAWRALAGIGQAVRRPCAVVAARRPTGEVARRRR